MVKRDKKRKNNPEPEYSEVVEDYAAATADAYGDYWLNINWIALKTVGALSRFFFCVILVNQTNSKGYLPIKYTNAYFYYICTVLWFSE